ncbi:MAG: hypothetical protein ACRYFZ_00705 [Janthinobacterium lividum]
MPLPDLLATPLILPPPTPPMPTLSITAKGVLYLHTRLREHLGLSYGQPINLLPPYAYGDKHWYLDLRPTAACQVLWNENTRMRVENISLPAGLVTSKLTLYLLPGEPEYPNYYPLLPENAFSS